MSDTNAPRAEAEAASGTPALTVDAAEGDGDMPAVVDALGKLPAGAIITEAGLAGIFNRCTASVKAAVERGELPRPVRTFGKNTWTAGSIIRHLEGRLEAEARKISRLRA